MTVEIDEIEIAVPAAVPQIVEAREEAAIRVRTRARVVSGWRCSDRTRAIFEACTVGGRSAAEVAREFGVSPGFVRIIRHRGLAKERKAAKRCNASTRNAFMLMSCFARQLQNLARFNNGLM